MDFKINLVTITPRCEETIIYIARVSSDNQDNPEIEKLIKYCIKNCHFSIFEHGFITIELNIPIMCARQIMRHRSFYFQEFSQRYNIPLKIAGSFYAGEFRLKNYKGNRQSSFITHPNNEEYKKKVMKIYDDIKTLYKEMLDNDVSLETARAFLPLTTYTRLYMSGNIRSWLFFINERCKDGTQRETREIALEIKKLLFKYIPIIMNAFFNE
jgi:thymidylate synthase (FAD)